MSLPSFCNLFQCHLLFIQCYLKHKQPYPSLYCRIRYKWNMKDNLKKINARIPAILRANQQKNLFPTKELIWNQSGWIVWNQALASTELRHWWDYELAGLINAICTHWPELRSFALVILARRFNNISFINIATLILMFYFKVKLCAFASHITLFSMLQTVSFGLTCPESSGLVKKYTRCFKICLRNQQCIQPWSCWDTMATLILMF